MAEVEFVAVIDRIEGDVAVLLPSGDAAAKVKAGLTLRWPKDLLPAGAAEGQYLLVKATLDPAATEAARRKVQDLLDALRFPSEGKDPGGKGGGRA